MTSLHDVYEGEVGIVAGPRRRQMGTAVFAAGAAMVAVAIPLATTGVGDVVGLSVFAARELAGVLAGLGLPATFVGIFAVLPASRVTRAAASIGASLAIFGVGLFVVAYPDRWLAADPALAVATTLVYGLGTVTTFWCLFVAVATVKLRNDPGGTARMEITEAGRLRIISEPADSHSGRGAVGLFGSGPDGSVPTQTNFGTSAGGTATTGETDAGEILEPTTSSDGAGAIDGTAGTDEVAQAVSARGRPDEYCGNCTHFEYVRADGELAPFCGFHDAVLDDMDACEQWHANSEPAPPLDAD